MSLSFWQILLVLVLFILLFGRGKIPALMSDVASGIKGFKKAMNEDEPQTNKEDEPDNTTTTNHKQQAKTTEA